MWLHPIMNNSPDQAYQRSQNELIAIFHFFYGNRRIFKHIILGGNNYADLDQ